MYSLGVLPRAVQENINMEIGKNPSLTKHINRYFFRKTLLKDRT